VAILIVFLFLLFAVFLPQYVKMREGIYRLSCKEIRRKVEVAVENYDNNNTKSIRDPGKEVNLDRLKASQFLAEIQYCPENGKYLFGPGSEVLCSIHRPRAEGGEGESR
jgi:competence protein ComGC